MKKSIIINLNILPFLICIMFLTGCSSHREGGHGHGPLEIGVETYLIKAQNSSKTIDTIGEFISPQSTILSTEIMGTVSYLDIPEGREVEKGHIIAKIEDSVSVAELKAEKAKLENSKENFKRMEGLYKEGAISRQAYDDSLEDYETAKAQTERAESIELKNIITSPFQGILSLKKVSLGAFVDPGDEIVRVTQISPLNLVFSIPEKYLQELKLNQTVNFYPSSSDKKDNVKKARITAIDPYIDADTRAIKIQAEVNNSSQDILPGGFAKVKLEVKNNGNSILIPEEAIINEGSGKSVYVVTSQNNALPKKVTLGKWEDGLVEITNGLMIGEKVITSGHQKVFPGAMVISSDYVPIKNTFIEHGHPE
jgi:membrane fusion protein (multidrug efflux system)